MEMEPVVQPETPVETLRLIRRMQATTIELCMANLAVHGVTAFIQHNMKHNVARVCGLTEEDFRREENGTQETEKEVSGGDFSYDRTDPKYRGGAD